MIDAILTTPLYNVLFLLLALPIFGEKCGSSFGRSDHHCIYQVWTINQPEALSFENRGNLVIPLFSLEISQLFRVDKDATTSYFLIRAVIVDNNLFPYIILYQNSDAEVSKSLSPVQIWNRISKNTILI